MTATFHQSVWFYAACSSCAVALLFLFYRLRMRQVKEALRLRLDERLAERERIARDLHDTLLQGLQGLILRFQAVAGRLRPDEPARVVLDKALNRADEVLLESRNRVHGLRSSVAMTELPEALRALGLQLAQSHSQSLEVAVAVRGRKRRLHPIVWEDTFLIAREALLNAFQHSGGCRVEVELVFGPTGLRLRVLDDGRGIEPAVLNAGGHLGLRSMRKRAGKLGSQLEIRNRAPAGTEIELRVPASVAYSGGSPPWD
jgi:signal transduction histidine kinase